MPRFHRNIEREVTNEQLLLDLGKYKFKQEEKYAMKSASTLELIQSSKYRVLQREHKPLSGDTLIPIVDVIPLLTEDEKNLFKVVPKELLEKPKTEKELMILERRKITDELYRTYRALDNRKVIRDSRPRYKEKKVEKGNFEAQELEHMNRERYSSVFPWNSRDPAEYLKK